MPLRRRERRHSFTRRHYAAATFRAMLIRHDDTLMMPLFRRAMMPVAMMPMLPLMATHVF